MATLDRQLPQAWYDALPGVFRDLDADGHLLAFLRSLGDYAGGLSLMVDVLAGLGFIRPLVLSDGTTLTVGSPLVGVGTLDPTTGGLIVVLDDPVTRLDTVNPDALVVTSDDWVLNDVQTVPREWLPWLAQVLLADLAAVPAERHRDWIEDPGHLAAGSLASIDAAARWHLLGAVDPVVVRDSQWEVSVTVAEVAVTTSEAEMLAAVRAMEPAGVRVTLTLT